MLVGTLVGLVNGLVTRFQLPAFIATLGMMSIARGITYGATGGWPVRSPLKEFNRLGNSRPAGRRMGVPVPVLVMLVLAVFTSIFLGGRTTNGRAHLRRGRNEEVARASGINNRRLKLLKSTPLALSGAGAPWHP